MNILITGVHGFVGSNLINPFKNQHSIYGLNIVSPQKEGVRKTFTWDELVSMPPIYVIIHLAGKAHDTKNQIKNLVLKLKVYNNALNKIALFVH